MFEYKADKYVIEAGIVVFERANVSLLELQARGQSLELFPRARDRVE